METGIEIEEKLRSIRGGGISLQIETLKPDKNLGRIFPRSSVERRTTSHMLTFLLAGSLYLC